MKKKVPTEEELEKFDWSYSGTESCYILEGEVEVTDSDTGEKIDFKKGDLVQFQDGLKCVWNVKKPVRKYYSFSYNFGDLV